MMLSAQQLGILRTYGRSCGMVRDTRKPIAVVV